MATMEEVKQIVAWIYIIPTFALYFLMMYLIFLSPLKIAFAGSFYQIYGISIIFYILYTLTYWIHYRMPTIIYLFPWLETWPAVHAFYPIIVTANYYACYVVIGFALLISFNRVTVFLLKHRYNTFWENYLKHLLYFFSFAPLIFVWNFPFLGISNVPAAGYGAYLAPTIEWPSWWNRTRNLVIELCFVGFLSFCMDCYSVYSIIKWKYFKYGNNSIQVTSQDIAMLAYSICLFCTDFFCASGQILLLIDRPKYISYVLSTQYLTIDILTLVPGWFVFVTSTPMRTAICKLIFYTKTTAAASVSPGINIL